MTDLEARNLNGMVGDARKRLMEREAADASTMPTFDRHPECLLCGRRDPHTHCQDHVREVVGAPPKGTIS